MKVHIYILKDPHTQAVRYVGQTVDTVRRLDKHIQTAKINKRHISNWIRSLSTKPILEVIEDCDSSISNERERYWIQYYKDLQCDLCNHSAGGEGAGIGNTNCVGRVLSEETKEKLRRANKQGRETKHIESGKIYDTLKEACKDLGLTYANEFNKLKKGTNKILLYIHP